MARPSKTDIGAALVVLDFALAGLREAPSAAKEAGLKHRGSCAVEAGYLEAACGSAARHIESAKNLLKGLR